MTIKEIKKEYLEFMLNSKNVENCKYCPENKGINNSCSCYNYPCGQQNCWVTIHLKQFKGYSIKDLL